MTYQASKQEDRFHCWPHMVGSLQFIPIIRIMAIHLSEQRTTHSYGFFPLFNYYTPLSTSSSQVRQFWTIYYTTALVSRLILAELTWIRHLVPLFTIILAYCLIPYYRKFLGQYNCTLLSLASFQATNAVR